jgi:phage baseplate assembly protein W
MRPITQRPTGLARAIAACVVAMIGMSAITGKTLSGDAHLAQSLGDILSTPIGSRLAPYRDYGSALLTLMDQPINGALPMLLRAATAIAIAKWEPRLAVSRVRFASEPAPQSLASGQFTILIDGQRTDAPAKNALQTLTIPLRSSAKS